MSNMSNQDQLTLFIDAISQRAAARILEMGTQDASFMVKIIGKANWASNIELHCTDSADGDFDEEVLNAGQKTSTEFELVKHVGSFSEVSDVIMGSAENTPFDAIFISSAPSSEELLTACMVGHESLKSDGILALSRGLMESAELSDAIASFRNMFAEAFDELADGIFLKA